jgi:hypothetical protein
VVPATPIVFVDGESGHAQQGGSGSGHVRMPRCRVLQCVESWVEALEVVDGLRRRCGHYLDIPGLPMRRDDKNRFQAGERFAKAVQCPTGNAGVEGEIRGSVRNK